MSESDRFLKKASLVCARAFKPFTIEKEGNSDESLSNVAQKKEGNMKFSLANALSSYSQEVGYSVNIRDSRKKLAAELFDNSATLNLPSNVITGGRLMRPFSCYMLPIGGLVPHSSGQSVHGDTSDDFELHLSMIFSQTDQQISEEKRSPEKSKDATQDDVDFDSFGDFDGASSPVAPTSSQVELGRTATTLNIGAETDDVQNNFKVGSGSVTERKPDKSHDSMQDDSFGADFGDFSGVAAVPSTHSSDIVSQLPEVEEVSVTIVKILERRTSDTERKPDTPNDSMQDDSFGADFGDFSGAAAAPSQNPDGIVSQLPKVDEVTSTIVNIPERMTKVEESPETEMPKASDNPLQETENFDTDFGDFGDYSAAEATLPSEAKDEVSRYLKDEQAATIVKIPKKHAVINEILKKKGSIDIETKLAT